jgi:hypothetical protein
MLVWPHVSHAGLATVLVDLNHVIDMRKPPIWAFVLAGAADVTRADKLHVVASSLVCHDRDSRTVGVTDRCLLAAHPDPARGLPLIAGLRC